MAKRDYEKYVNRQLGRLTVLKVIRKKGEKIVLLCRCECGKLCSPLADNVARGLTKGCGCKVDAGNTIHGKWNSREYRSWATAIQRCHNENNTGYKHYGALGVTVCERWRESFVAFMKDMGPRPPDTSLDRIDPFGNYEPLNCRWADKYTQANNKRAKRAGI